MAKFKLTQDGATYMVEAPDEQSALSALKKMRAGEAVGNERGSALDPLTQGATASFSDEIAGAFAAGLQALGVPGALGPMSPGDAYSAYRDRARTNLGNFREDNPALSTGLEIAGAIPTAVLPIGHVARGATLGARVGRSAIAGGGFGAVQGAGAADPQAATLGESVTMRVPGAIEGAAIGGAFGGAAPLAGRAIGAGVNAVRRARHGGRAADFAAQALEADGFNQNTIRPALNDLGPEGMIADLGPNAQSLGGGVASMPGRGQRFMRQSLDDRATGANQRIGGELDQTLGPAPIPAEVEAGIREGQRALSPAYQAALANARAVDTLAIANGLDAEIVNLRGPAQARLAQVRDMLNIAGQEVLDPNPGTLLHTRQAIDGMLDGEMDGNVRRVLTAARQQIDAELTNAVPGIKQVDAQFAELARQREAFQRGRTVLDSGRDAPVPQELAAEYAQGSVPQGLMVGPSAVPLRMSQGARTEIERIVGTNSNDVVALNRLVKGEGSWNRDRLATLFGPARADRIIRVLDRERQFAGTDHVVRRNSETARRQQVQEMLSPTPAGGDGMVRSALNLRLGDAMARPADWMRRVNATNRADNVRDELAWILASRPAAHGPLDPQIEALTRALLRRDSGRRVEGAVTGGLGVIGRGTVPQLLEVSPY